MRSHPAVQALNRATRRSHHLPGMTCFYGPSGYGKSMAAAYTANQFDAEYVSCKSTWTAKAFLDAVLRELGVKPANTLYAMSDQASEQLLINNKPLIVDEADHLIERKSIEIIRDIYEGARTPILLIGEENLPSKLKRWERIHGRILDFIPAQPISGRDISELIRIYAPDLHIAPDLIKKIELAASGSARRACVNLDRIREHCAHEGINQIDSQTWGERELFTGQAPRRRNAA